MSERDASHSDARVALARAPPRAMDADVAVVDGADADLIELRAVERRATLARAREDRASGASTFGHIDDGKVARADVAAARRAHERAGVLEYDVDHRGVHVPSSARRFSMLASHRRVGASSVSLALYLDTALQFGILALVLAATNAYSLIKNVMDESFTASYTVTGWDASAGANATTTCARTYETDGVVLSTSQGSRCGISTLESFYNCPMRCDYEGAIGTFNATHACETHYPCTLKGVLTTAQAAACCEPRVAVTVDKTPTEFQAISIVVTLVFLLFDAFYTRNRATAAAIIKASAVTASDYSVLVSGLGKGNEWTRQQLAEFFAHYGEVVSVCHLTNTRRHVTLERKIRNAVQQRDEIQAILDDNEGVNKDDTIDSFTLLRRKVFSIVALKGTKPTREAVVKLDAKIAKLKAKVVALGTSGDAHLGSAVVTFNYEQHAINCCEDHCGDFAEMIISRVTGKHPPDFNGRQLVVTRAPEPSDINWQHLRRRESNWEIVRIAIGAKLVLACALVIGGIIQYFFEVLRSNELENITNEVAFQSTASTSSYIRLQLVASSTSLMVVIINFLLDRLTVYLAQVEVYKTKTIETNMLIATLTFVNLLNYVIVPIVTNRCSSAADGVCNWYVPGGFIEYAFYLQVFNVLLLPFRNMNIDHLIKVKMLAPMAKTLSMQESLLRPPAFALARSYAELLKIIGLSAIYAPALPVSYAISVFGLFVLYWCKKYQGLYLTTAPPKLREDAFGITITARVINLLQILFGCLVFYRFDDGISTTLWANIGIWAVALIPIRKFGRLCIAQKELANSTEDVSFIKNAGLNDTRGEARSIRSDETYYEMPEMRVNQAPEVTETRSRRVRTAFLCRMYKCETSELVSKGRLGLYHPPIPTHASPEQLETLLKNFEPFSAVVPANANYLPGQTHSTGGDNTAPPFSRNARAKLDILASFQKRKRERMQNDASEEMNSP